MHKLERQAEALWQKIIAATQSEFELDEQFWNTRFRTMVDKYADLIESNYIRMFGKQNNIDNSMESL